MSGTEAVNTPAPVESPPPLVDEAPVVETDPFEDPRFDDATIESFDRKTVEALRKENAKRRTQLKAYEDTYSSWDPESVNVWNTAIKLSALDAKAGAEMLQDLAKALLGEGDAEGAAAALDKADAITDADDDDRPLTKKEMQAFLAEREQAKNDEAAVTAVQVEAKALGYESGTADYLDLLNRAKLNHNYDINAAHAAKQAEKQATIDAWVAERVASGDKWIKSPGGAGAAPNEERPPADFKSAKASLKERLSKL